MTQPPNSQSPNLPSFQSTNPYVGPRTFTEREGRFFFGREREARDLTARIVSERLLLFYAQSGAGKSSLLNARVIPRLRDEERFQVLPVGRVSGELPAGVAQVDNIYAFNLMTSLDQSDDNPARLAQVPLSDFLARLARETALNAEGQRVARWVYKPELAVERAEADGQAAGGPRFALVIDQFEEIITGHAGRWREREAFFRQLNQALLDDPNLWVVLALREDYVAALDPYAELTFNRLRARFYMERMQVSSGLDAIRKPAELGRRPFAPGVAEKLADDLRQVHVAGQEATVPGQYLEPVQLQVVCYQLWENLVTRAPLALDGRAPQPGGFARAGGEGEITFEDLAQAGNVDQALTEFYEETLAAALGDPAAAGVSERQLRAWFDGELITEAGTRGLVHQGQHDTGGLPNGVVSALQQRFLVRAEARGGDVWIELVHDRFVEPIRASNAAWFPQHLSALQRQAVLWEDQKRPDGLLLTGTALAEAEGWAEAHEAELESHERDFLTACQEARRQAERERRQKRVIGVLAIVAALVAVLAIALFFNAREQTRRAKEQEALAVEAKQNAEAQERTARSGSLIAMADMALRIDDYDRAVLLTVESLRNDLIKEALASALRINLHPWHTTLFLEDAMYGPAIWSADGSRLVIGGRDGNIYVWDTETGQELMRLQGHTDTITGIAWGPDETQMLTRGYDETIRIWDMETGSETYRLIYDENGAAHMVDRASGQDIFRTEENFRNNSGDPSWDYLLGEDSNHFVAFPSRFNPEAGVRVWDLRSGEEVLRIAADEVGAHELTLNPSQNRIVAVSDDGTTYIWDTKGGTDPFTLEGITALFWNRDGSQVIAASNDGPAYVWDVEHRKILTTLNGLTGTLNAASWSRNEGRVATISDNRTVVVWDATTGEMLTAFDSPDNVLEVGWNQDDTRILTLYAIKEGWSGSETRIWDAGNGKVIFAFPPQYNEYGYVINRVINYSECNFLNQPHVLGDRLGEFQNVQSCDVRSPLWSQDGSRILDSRSNDQGLGDITMQVWNANDGVELLRLDANFNGQYSSFSWSPTGRHILLYKYNGVELRALRNRSDTLNWHASYSEVDDFWTINGSINRSVYEDGLLGENYFSQSLSETLGLDGLKDDGLSEETLTGTRDDIRKNLIDDICATVARNMTWEEWQTTMTETYRPTCPNAPIPGSVIWGIREQASALAQADNLSAAADRVGELIGWLQENGQFDRSAAEPSEWLAALEAGKNPWETTQ